MTKPETTGGLQLTVRLLQEGPPLDFVAHIGGHLDHQREAMLEWRRAGRTYGPRKIRGGLLCFNEDLPAVCSSVVDGGIVL